MIRRIVCAALALYAAILSVAWIFGTRHARQKTEALLDFALIDFNDTTEGIAKLLSDAGVVGFKKEDFTPERYEWLLGHFYDDWLIGEKGFFLCADLETGRLVSNPARHRNEATTLAETGFNGEAVASESWLEDSAETALLNLFGEPCYCRVIYRHGHIIVAAVPMTEFYGSRTVFVSVTGIGFFVILALFAYFIARISRDSKQLAQYYATEEAHRARDMKVATAIQRAALPTASPAFPERPEFDLEAHLSTAREVGGDFYDYFMLTADHLAFVIADVSGKGVPAAMFMMAARGAVRSAAEVSHSVSEILAIANARLAGENDAEMFVTAWLGILDITTGKIEFANAGHNPPLIRRMNGEVETVEGPRSLVLAAMPKTRYRTGSLRLNPGDALLLYTDGVTEANDTTGAFFGDERLSATLASAASNAPSTICNQLRFTLAAFAAGAPQADDITILALQYRPRVLSRNYLAVNESLKCAADFFNAALASERIPMSRRRNIAVILDEVISNIVRCSKAKSFSLNISFAQKDIKLTISDDGEPYDPLKHVDPDTTAAAGERQIGGLGIFLARRLASSIVYRRENDRNVLEVIS